MNYLAHMYLSGNNPEIMTGNFLGDAVKGKNISKYSDGIQKGILLHRKIDSYTDQHFAVKKSTHRLMHKYHKYSTVIVDMYFDHFLSKFWDDYSTIPISTLTDKNYGILLRKFYILPKKAKILLPFMARYNWLIGYADFDRLERAFKGMSKMTKFKSNMEFAVEDLKKDYDLYFEDFRLFFPDIINYVIEQGVDISYLKNN